MMAWVAMAQPSQPSTKPMPMPPRKAKVITVITPNSQLPFLGHRPNEKSSKNQILIKKHYGNDEVNKN